MKSRVAGERADSEAPYAPTVRKGAITEEFPAGDEPDADEDEDPFKEIPTVANRARPAGATGNDKEASSPADPHASAGTYRIVHPTTSDVIAAPATPKGDASPSKGMVLGPARKPKP